MCREDSLEVQPSNDHVLLPQMTVLLIGSVKTVQVTITLGGPIKTVVSHVTGEPGTLLTQVNVIIIMVISTLGLISAIVTVLVFITHLITLLHVINRFFCIS